MFPLFVMPEWLRSISNISPVKWGICAIKGAICRNFSLLEIAGPCALLLTIPAVFFLLGCSDTKKAGKMISSRF